VNHLYGNIIASIDVETTGLDPKHAEIIQIAVVPLDEKLRPGDQLFYMNVRPDHPEWADPKSLAINGLTVEDLEDAPSQERVADMLMEWAEKFLPFGRKFIPLCHNYIFEHGFLNAWLGKKAFEHLFHYHPRDAMSLGISMKDRAGLLGQPVPFESVGLPNLCKHYGIVNDKPHDALADAIAEADLYRAMLNGL
jgi:DNA polymerase III epsilon subunit-like protein